MLTRHTLKSAHGKPQIEKAIYRACLTALTPSLSKGMHPLQLCNAYRGSKFAPQSCAHRYHNHIHNCHEEEPPHGALDFGEIVLLGHGTNHVKSIEVGIVPVAEAVMFAMLASFILSRTLVPTMAQYMLAGHGGHDAHGSHAERPPSKNPLVRLQQSFEAGFERFRASYHAALGRAIAARRR